MSTHKSIDKICIVIVAVTIIIALLFCNGTSFGIGTMAYAAGYESRLFDNSRVHTIDIVMDDWDGFIENTCERKEYSACSVVIDGEAFKNIGIRGKGNTSLNNVSMMDSSRYSFKIEFDHYDDTKSYHGLDKLSLNNIIQDNTFMKDYLSYTLMNSFGVNSPLCSYAYITVNGEDFGLYLAVEGVEEAFLRRNYGTDYGDLYKPDSMGFGGQRGNGMDFDIADFMDKFGRETNSSDSDGERHNFVPQGGMPSFNEGGKPEFGFNMPDFNDENSSEFSGKIPMGMGGMGSSDVKLQYIDDDPESYSNIFDNAKTDVSDADKTRLISSLKSLSEGSDIENAVNVDEVIRYFAVHNFLCNGDSYTGQMIHNYYLYEEDGQLSMIPWDYNLAFGTFQVSNASSTVNSPIDTPVSGGMSDRPMIAWIFDSEEYTQLYHELLGDFITQTDFADLIDSTAALIDEYVQKDPTKFCTYEEFKKGVETIREFCLLRAKSISGQLDGSIPSTSDGQSADKTALIDASSVTLSDMGTMNIGGGGKVGFGGGKGGFGENKGDAETVNRTAMQQSGGEIPDNFNGLPHVGFGVTPPEGLGGEFPDNFGSTLPQGSGSESSGSSNAESGGVPNGNTESFGGNMPGGMTPPNVGSDAFLNAPGGNKIPSMNGFPGMNGGSSDNDTADGIVLLCVSVGVLAVGLLFAVMFKK